MIKNKMLVVITTSGALDHDIARFFSNYLEDSFTLDDRPLADQNNHRLENVLVPMNSYGPLIEEKMQKFLERSYKDGKKEMFTSEITRMIGQNLGGALMIGGGIQNTIHYGRINTEMILIIQSILQPPKSLM